MSSHLEKPAEAKPPPRPDPSLIVGRPEISKPLWGNPVTWLRRKLTGKRPDAS
jgi:hypothetical protein